LEAIT